MTGTRFRKPIPSAVLAVVLIFFVLPVVAGCSVRIDSLDAPTNVDGQSTYVVTLALAPRAASADVRGVIAFRYPEHWDVSSVAYSGVSHTGTASYSPNIAGFFGNEWEATNGSRHESITWNYVWWAGYTPVENWDTDDSVTVTVTFNTHYRMANALLDGYLLDFVTGYSPAEDPETITDAATRSLWASGGSGDALGQRLDVRARLFAFTDVRPGDPYDYAIEQIAHRQVVDGYSHADTTREFRPDSFLGRAQFCKMVVKGLTRDQTTITEDEDLGLPFTDLGSDQPTDLYWHEYIARAHGLGITTGTTATTFSPWLTLSRCQAVTMITRAVGIYWAGDPTDPPADYINAWGKTFDPVHGPAAWRAEYWGLLENVPVAGAASDPWAPIPRGEMAQLVWNAIVFVTPPHYLH